MRDGLALRCPAQWDMSHFCPCNKSASLSQLFWGLNECNSRYNNNFLSAYHPGNPLSECSWHTWPLLPSPGSFFPLPILCYSPDAPAIMAFPQISEYNQLVQTCQSSSVVCLDSFPYVFPWLTHSQFSQPKSHFEKPYLTVLFTVPGYLPTEQLFANIWPSFVLLRVLISATEIPVEGKQPRTKPFGCTVHGKTSGVSLFVYLFSTRRSNSMSALITTVSPTCPRHSFQLNDCVNSHYMLGQTVSALNPFPPVIGNCEIEADWVLFQERLYHGTE